MVVHRQNLNHPFAAFLWSRPRIVQPGDAERSLAEGTSIQRHSRYQPGGARRSGTKCPVRVRRYPGRFDITEAVQNPGAACSSGASGPFQHLQPPEFQEPDQLPQFATIRAIDSDAGSIARKAARMAASIRCIKLAARDRCNWP
jgi:hypothetical protein